MSPETNRVLQGGNIDLPASLGKRRSVLAAGTLAGALLVCAPAQAQTAIGERIEATFDLVLGNSVELAVPLTRRALVRRSIEESDGVEPLPYSAVAEPAAPAPPSPLDEAEADAVEQGSAEDSDIELARLPRPRPVVISEATGDRDLIGQPLDLVAGAAVAAPDEQAAAAPAHAEAAVAAPAHAEAPAPLIVPAAPAPAAVELVAADACLSLADVADRDGDFKRNAEALSSDGLCIAQEEFKERRRPWIIQTVKSKRPGPLWAVMHDDEDLSFDSAVAALQAYGGTLVTLETGGKRNLSGVDPNRNFSADGIGCRKLGDDASPRFTKFFRDLIDPSQPIMALHNNTRERIPTGGLGHVSMGLVPKGMRSAPADGGPLASDHALVLLAASDLDDPMTESRTAVLNGRGINVVVERVPERRGDCSLSNYAVLIDNPNYFNVTVGQDEAEEQMGIVDVLMSGRSDTVASQ